MIKVEASYPIQHLDAECEHVTRKHYVKAQDIVIEDSHILIKLDKLLLGI